MFGMLPVMAWQDGTDTLDRSDAALLLHCDGTNGSQSVPDSSSYARTVTCFSSSLTTSQFKFGTASLFFTGSTSYANIPDSPTLEFGSSDFSIETWIRPTTFPTSGVFAGIATKRSTGSSQVSWDFTLLNSSGAISLIFDWSTSGTGGTGSISSSYNFNTGVWVHVAVYRRGPLIMLAINGVICSAASIGTQTIFNGTSILSLGRLSSGNTSNLYAGQIDDFCITIGRAPHGWNFRIPSRAYSP